VIDLTKPVVINLALTGMVPRKQDNAAVPVTPEEVVADAVRCYAEGARIFHIHARGADQEPTYEREYYATMTRGIRAAVPDAVICVTTSGRRYRTFEQRSDSLRLEGELKADLASLTLGSLNFPKQASVNEPEMIQRLALEMKERGIVPELEIFDFGMIDYAHYLIGRKILEPPFVFNLLLGSLGTSAATAMNLAMMVERLPREAFWSAAGIGRFQFSMNALGLAMGGHVRTGLEDNLYMDTKKEVPATNGMLTARLAAAAVALGRRVATTTETRTLLGLR